MTKWLPNLSGFKLSKTTEELVNRALDRPVRLAATGLRGSGKTVFITSLVYQPLHGLHSSQLPFWAL